MSEYIAGVAIHDSRIANETNASIQNTESPVLYHHSRRTYLFGMLHGQRLGIKADPDLLYVAAMFHDLGLVEGHPRTALERHEMTPTAFPVARSARPDLVISRSPPRRADHRGLWAPAEDHWTMHRDDDGLWRPDWQMPEPEPIPMPAIGWLTWHPGWVVEHHHRPTARTSWPGDAASTVRWLRNCHTRWVDLLAQLTEADLDSEAPYPWPPGAGRTLIDTVTWANAELMKNVAEIGRLRMLSHAHRANQASPPPPLDTRQRSDKPPSPDVKGQLRGPDPTRAAEAGPYSPIERVHAPVQPIRCPPHNNQR